MSPNVGNFVHDLVEMAKAMETLPQVQNAFDLAVKRNEELAQTVQDRELAIISYKQEIDDLHAKVRSLEVERDDASFRVLEAEEQTYRATVLARAMQTTLGSLINEIDPPKPEPVKEPEPQQGQSVSDPTSSQTGYSKDILGAGSVPEAVHSLEETSSGQSEGNPIASTLSDEQIGGSVSETVIHSDTVSSSTDHGPYFGKRYCDVRGYISIHDWITGGGLDEDYWIKAY